MGRDLLTRLGLILDFDQQLVEWDQATIPFRPHPRDHQATVQDITLNNEDEEIEKGYKSRVILASSYEKIPITDIV